MAFLHREDIEEEVGGLLKNYPCTSLYKASIALCRFAYGEDEDPTKYPITVWVTASYYGGYSMTDFLLVFDAIQKHVETYDMGLEVRLDVHYVRYGLVPPVEDIFEGMNASGSEQQVDEIRGCGEQATGEQAAGEKDAGEQDARKQAAVEQYAGEQDTLEQAAREKDARQRGTKKQDTAEQAAGEKAAEEEDTGKQGVVEHAAGEEDTGQQDIVEHPAGAKATGDRDAVVASV